MVHVFSVDELFLAVDECSGSVYALDELSARVIERYEKMEAAAIVRELAGQFDPKEIREVIEEVDRLRDQQILFTQWKLDEIELNSQKVVKSMCLNVAHDCNLRCAYCFAGTGAFHGGRCLMSFEVGAKALDFLVARPGSRVNLEVDFFGGEPLMNWQVVKDLVAYGRQLEKAHNKKIHFTITTNGLAMDDEVIDFMNREMENVVISLDGRRQVHDRLRPQPGGKGSFDAILPRAKALVEKRRPLGRDYYIRGTYTHYNLDFTEDVMALNREGFDQISVEPVVTDLKMPYALQKSDLPAIRAEYEKLMRLMARERAKGNWFNFFHFMIDLGNGPCAIKRLTGCGAGNEYVAVSPQGDIYPCHQFVGEEQFKMGNVLEGTFDEAMQEPFRVNHVLHKAKCKDCWAKFYCSGGCAANAWHQNGDISKPYDMECEIERKRVECAIALHYLEEGAKGEDEGAV